MGLADWIFGHRRFFAFFLLIITIAGFIAIFKLPVTLFPYVNFPRVFVDVDAGEMTIEQMVLQVMMPVEQAVRAVPNVVSARSVISRGSADISINFAWGTDNKQAALQVNAALSQILPSLPAGISLETVAMDPTQFPMLAYSLTSETETLTQLRDLAVYKLTPILSNVNGVARVQVQGGEKAEYQVLVDPLRLKAYQVTIDDITVALNANNDITAISQLEDKYKLFLVLANNPLHDLGQIQQTIIKSSARGLVRLNDVANVIHGTELEWIKVTADGHNAVLISVYQQPGSNSVELSRAITKKFKESESSIPPGVKIANWYDQSKLVIESAKSARDAILIGLFLAALLMWLFLRNTKVALFSFIVVPAALVSSIAMMYLFGMGFDIMTLGGLAAAVGLINHDATVMLEHIMLCVRSRDPSVHKPVLAAAEEFFKPLFGSSAAAMITFLPLTFLTGVTGAFFKALSLTMVSCLLFSFLLSWIAVPLMADRWLKEKDCEETPPGRLLSWMHRRYYQLMEIFFKNPISWMLALIVPLILAGVIAYKEVGTGFIPAIDEGGFVLDYMAAPGTSLSETDRLLKQVEAIIKANPNVQTYSRRTGTQLGGGVTEANEGDFFIRLKPFPRQHISEVMESIREQVISHVPGLTIELTQLMEDLIGDLTAVPQPIEIKIFAADYKQLHIYAEKVAQKLREIPDVVDVKDGIFPAGSAMEIHIDPVKAAVEGATTEQITQQLTDYLAGMVATQVLTETKAINIKVMLPFKDYSTANKLSQLMLTAPDGHLFPLQRVATIDMITGQPQINHENFKPMVAVTARIFERDMGSVIRDVKEMLSQDELLPNDVYYQLGGMYEQQQLAFRELVLVLLAAFVLVFFVKFLLYENISVVITLMFVQVLAISGVFIGLYITGTELNIASMIGLTMILGIVTEVTIFYFSVYFSLIKTRPLKEALIETGINRIRPISMTSFAAILALLPLAMSIGNGAAMLKPLAIAIIFGLLSQGPLSLIVMPLFFYLLNKKHFTKAVV